MKIIIHPDFSAEESFIRELPSAFRRGEGHLLHDGRNKLRIFEYGGKCYAVKRFKDVNMFQRLAYTFFRKTKAERAFRYAAIFRQRGIETPHEVAFIEENPGGLFLTGYFICLYCPNPPAFPVLVPPEHFDEIMADDLAVLVARMHQKGIVFGDLNLGNFLYQKKSDGHYDFSVVDINRSRFMSKALPFDACMENLRTMTHREDLFRHILQKYADEQQWDRGLVVDEALRAFRKFVERYRKKNELKKLFKNR